jgi:CP family cyanate transporter-like MFS transporter
VCFTLSQGFASWLPTILESKGFSPSRAGLWSSLSRLMQVPGSIGIGFAVGQVRIRNARKRTVCGLLAVTAVTVLLMAPDLHGGTYPLLLLQGGAIGAIMPLLLALIMDLSAVPASQMATAAALYFTVGQVAGAGAPVVVGWLHDTTGGFTAGLALVGGITLAAIAPASRIRDEHQPEPAVASRATPPGVVSRAEA